MRRRLIWITGFPRTGTTWLMRQLRRCDGVGSIPEEQGLALLWAMRRDAIGPAQYDAWMRELWALGTQPGEMVYRVFLAGCHAVKHMQREPVRTIDALTAGSGDWLTKTPRLTHDDWPDVYIDQTEQFAQARVICCRRDVGETWESGLRKWPYWQQEFGEQRFRDLHAAYYETAEARAWRIIHHADMHADPQGSVDRLCDWLGWQAVEAEPFIRSVDRDP